MPSLRSAANPASHPSLPRRASPPDCSPGAGSRFVTGLSRASCRAPAVLTGESLPAEKPPGPFRLARRWLS